LCDHSKSTCETRGLPAGNFQIQLIVTGVDGDTATDFRSVTILEKTEETSDTTVTNNSPVAKILISYDEYSFGDSILIDASGSTADNGIKRIIFTSSQDGLLKEGTSKSLTVDNLSVGTHNITVKVIDENGLSDEATAIVTIKSKTSVQNQPSENTNNITNEPPVAVLESDNSSYTSGDTVKLDGSKSTDDKKSITNYTFWSSIDGTLQSGTSSTYSSDKLSIGEHTIKLTVEDSQNETDFTKIDIKIEEEKIPDYEKSGSVVIDRLNSLVWQDTWTSEYNWNDAKNYCSSLSLDNRNWRLPTRSELLSLAKNSNLRSYFSSITNSNSYWTSTIFSGNGAGAYVVYFINGTYGYFAYSAERNVKCVSNL
jgi:hypothetical protein